MYAVEAYVNTKLQRILPIPAAGLILCAIAQSAAADPPAFASSWVKEPHARARLVAGGRAADIPAGTIAAGIEIELADGWKTYWRNPGSSGVPPLFDWSAASNLASVEVRYPAPARLADRGGDTIGYKQRLILPLIVRPADPKREITLTLSLEYGVCKDICIPAQARLELVLPPGAEKEPIASDLSRALDRVPRSPGTRRPSDPELSNATVVLGGDKPEIRLDVTIPGGAEGADLFIEAPDGAWIPMAKPEGPPKGDRASFLVDLSEGADIADLKGKTARITMVSPRGQSEAMLKLE